MLKISLIAAVDLNNGLGKNNQLLCHLPADLQHFKHITMGKPILMGRKTYLSIGRPLPGRRNIVLSHQLEPSAGIEIMDSFEEACQKVQEPELMVIGGAGVFKDSLSLASTIYLTIIHHVFEADVFFPKLDDTAWQREVLSIYHRDENNPYDMTFLRLDRR